MVGSRRFEKGLENREKRVGEDSLHNQRKLFVCGCPFRTSKSPFVNWAIRVGHSTLRERYANESHVLSAILLRNFWSSSKQHVCPFLESLVMIYMFSCHNFMTIQVTMTTTQFKCDKMIYWIKGPGQSSGNYIAINEEGIKEFASSRTSMTPKWVTLY